MVSVEVSSDGTSSTSWSTGTGLKKWTPITWVGREVTTPSFMIGIEEVLDARIASGAATIASSRRNRSTLAVSSSTIASTTTSRSASASRSVTTRIRAEHVGRRVDLALGLGALQRLLQPAERGLRRVLARLDHDDVLPGARADLGDAGPHQAAADHTHVLHDASSDRVAATIPPVPLRRRCGGFGPWDGAAGGVTSRLARRRRVGVRRLPSAGASAVPRLGAQPAGGAPLLPGSDGGLDVARHRDQRRALGSW